MANWSRLSWDLRTRGRGRGIRAGELGGCSPGATTTAGWGFRRYRRECPASTATKIPSFVSRGGCWISRGRPTAPKRIGRIAPVAGPAGRPRRTDPSRLAAMPAPGRTQPDWRALRESRRPDSVSPSAGRHQQQRCDRDGRSARGSCKPPGSSRDPPSGLLRGSGIGPASLAYRSNLRCLRRRAVDRPYSSIVPSSGLRQRKTW